MRNSGQALGVLSEELQRKKLPPLITSIHAVLPVSSSRSRATAGSRFLIACVVAAAAKVLRRQVRWRSLWQARQLFQLSGTDFAQQLWPLRKVGSDAPRLWPSETEFCPQKTDDASELTAKYCDLQRLP